MANKRKRAARLLRNVSFFDLPIHADHYPHLGRCVCGAHLVARYVEVEHAEASSVEFWQECAGVGVIVSTGANVRSMLAIV